MKLFTGNNLFHQGNMNGSIIYILLYFIITHSKGYKNVFMLSQKKAEKIKIIPCDLDVCAMVQNF